MALRGPAFRPAGVGFACARACALACALSGLLAAAGDPRVDARSTPAGSVRLQPDLARLPATQPAQPDAGLTPDFARDIQPILQAACYRCHGPRRARGQLRLDRQDLALKGGESGPAVRPGDSEHSLLIRRVLGLDEEERMPLEEDPLSDAQIALLRAWIDAGAPWPGDALAARAADGPAPHWAYVRPQPDAPPPVRDARWPRNDLDRFVLARLEREGLSPSPEASPERLIRRLSLDLIGLPPSLEEVDAFVADTRPDAYDRLVDRLLASPHYGERWARPWLDLARYADSHGLEKDLPRVMWRYRDWVIDALNADTPFDRFTIEQIAGDMLPDPTPEQLIATGFHRNTMLNQEGGIDLEEARWETIVDRVHTTATVWLGTTLACAQCHNHKYDPFSQRDYYRFFAFFDNVEYTAGGAAGGDRWIQEPQLDLPTPDQAARREELQAQIAGETKRIETASLDEDRQLWEAEVRRHPEAWTVLPPDAYDSSGNSRLTRLDDGSVLAAGPPPAVDVYEVEARVPFAGLTGIRLEALPDASLPGGGPGRDPYGNFQLDGIDVEIAAPGEPAAFRPVSFAAAAADSALSRVDISSFAPRLDRSGRYAPPRGWGIDATRDAARLPRQLVLAPEAPLDAPAGSAIRVRLRHEAEAVGQAIGRFRLSVTAAPEPLDIARVPVAIRHIAHVPDAARTEEQRTQIAEHYRSIAPVLAPARERLAELRKALDALGIVTALIMRERPSHERPSTLFRARGSFMSPGERVHAGVPAALHPLRDDQMPNRLGLARWLVDDDNPLVGRVVVNRAWEQFFGRGLVETSEDFGTQSEPPSHPELLDWLAGEFVRQGWSQKALHRVIVSSATYRQSSRAGPDLIERDPYNRLLARGPRFRVEAEMVRDITLAVSGLLSRKMGGPSVFPPQPEGIWQNPYSDHRWETSEGEDRYRRGLYTFIRRTSPYPGFVTFDAPSREFCTVRRVRTNTPLQALTLLNDEVYFEAARHLALRILRESPAPDESARAAHGLRLAVQRRPEAEEIARTAAAYRRLLDRFRDDPAAARQVSGLGEGATNGADLAEHAAWTLVANALLNLDETVTKH